LIGERTYIFEGSIIDKAMMQVMVPMLERSDKQK